MDTKAKARTRYYIGWNGQKHYPSTNRHCGGRPMSLGKCWAICDLLDSPEAKELELAVPDILPGAAEVGVSVAGRDPDFNDFGSYKIWFESVTKAGK